MSKKNYILIVFEGERTEEIIFNSLTEHFLQDKTNRIIYSFHCGEIYSLYNKLQKPETESLFFILKETLQMKNPVLKDIIEEYVESIYMFFDYDNHAPTADDDKLQNMIEFFDDEFENGKLFISYPMVESIKHLKVGIDFKEITAISEKAYKQIARNNCNDYLKQFGELKENKLLKENWDYIINEHCKKANFIVNDSFEFPNNIIEQIEIFESQKEKYIDSNKVAVLSAFPLFLLDYHGVNKLKD